MASLLRILKTIDRVVRGGESWHAAWQAIKGEIKESWPDFLPTIGSVIVAMWTWLTGSALPWAVLAGLVAFVAAYVALVARESRHGRADASPSVEPPESSGATAHDFRDLRATLDKLQNSVTRIDSKSANLNADISALLHNAFFVTSYILVNNVLQHAPALDRIEKMDEGIEVADGYVSYARRMLKDTRLFNDLEAILMAASNEAQARFSATDRDEIPADVHPETYRTFLISMQRCHRAIMFLKHHNRVMPEEHSRIDMILDRINLR